jgi:hypothetical protein
MKPAAESSSASALASNGGKVGVDKGAGVRFQILPPGYKEKAAPEGYIPLQSDIVRRLPLSFGLGSTAPNVTPDDEDRR